MSSFIVHQDLSYKDRHLLFFAKNIFWFISVHVLFFKKYCSHELFAA